MSDASGSPPPTRRQRGNKKRHRRRRTSSSSSEQAEAGAATPVSPTVPEFDALLLYSIHGYTDAQVRHQYTRMALLAHPDVGGTTQAMQDLNTAYSRIRTHAQREALLLAAGIKDEAGAIPEQLRTDVVNLVRLEVSRALLERDSTRSSSTSYWARVRTRDSLIQALCSPHAADVHPSSLAIVSVFADWFKGI
jgi:hypothetical protein